MDNHASPKPLAMGLEMPQGRWILEADGTLHFFGGDFLLGGGFGTYRKKVKRIVIDDFLMIGDHLFENFSQCEEVVLSRDFVSVGAEAFAHCHRLERVVHSEDWEAAEDAFLDTPFQAAQEGKPFVPPEARQSLIASGPVGRRFLESLHNEIDRMRTLPERKDKVWAPDDVEWFADSVNLLHEGFNAGEPPLMYLYARCIQGKLTIDGSANMEDFVYELLYPGMEYWDAFDRVFEHQDEIVLNLFEKAAAGGSAHAALWIEYCREKGLRPFENAASFKVGEAMATLEMEELSFLKDEFLDMVEEAYDADREEDIIGDEHGFRKGEYEHLVPDPSWRTLHLRYIELAMFTLRLGLPFIPRTRGYDYEWPQNYDDLAGKIARTAEDWENWYKGRK